MEIVARRAVGDLHQARRGIQITISGPVRSNCMLSITLLPAMLFSSSNPCDSISVGSSSVARGLWSVTGLALGGTRARRGTGLRRGLGQALSSYDRLDRGDAHRNLVDDPAAFDLLEDQGESHRLRTCGNIADQLQAVILIRGWPCCEPRLGDQDRTQVEFLPAQSGKRRGQVTSRVPLAEALGGQIAQHGIV